MNKLITTNNGGYPFVLDDLRFVDDSVREALKNIFRPYGGTTNTTGFLINLDIDFTTVMQPGTVIPETGVFMNGEIWTLPSFTLPNPSGSSNYIWIASDNGFTNTAPGLKVMQNGTSVNSYEIRKAQKYLSNTYGGVGYESQFKAFYYNANEGGWIIEDQASLKWLMNQKTGLNTQIGQLNLINAQLINTNTTVNSHETRLDAIDAPWTIYTGNTLRSMINWKMQNGNITSATVYPSPIGNMDTTSFLKCKIIGKTMFVNIDIKNFILPNAYFTGAVTSGTIIANIIFDFGQFLGLNNINPYISGTVNVSERDMLSFGSNIAFVQRESSKYIKLTANDFSNESGIAWNYNYFLTQTTAPGYTTTQRNGGGVATTQNPKISIRGSFSFEID